MGMKKELIEGPLGGCSKPGKKEWKPIYQGSGNGENRTRDKSRGFCN